MWSSMFKTEKNDSNLFKDILNLIKVILIVANDFMNLHVLDVLIDVLDTLTKSTNAEHVFNM